MKRIPFLISLLLAWAGATFADGDQDEARKAFEAGEIVSLANVLDAVERSFEGEVIEVELERYETRWVYEVELLTPRGRVVELTYDAATVRLETTGASVEAARRK